MTSIATIQQSIASVKLPIVGQLPGQVDQLPHQRSSLVTTVLKHAVLFGGVGAVAGAALSLTALPIVGALTAPIAAAIGGAIGVATGVVVGLIRHHRGSTTPPGLPPVPPTVPPGEVLPPPVPVGVQA